MLFKFQSVAEEIVNLNHIFEICKKNCRLDYCSVGGETRTAHYDTNRERDIDYDLIVKFLREGNILLEVKK